MKKHLGLAAVLGVGLTVALATPAAAATTGTIYVPDDFAVSETRATGHFEVTEDGGLHIWTEGSTSTDKVAEYVATDAPLAGIDEPSLQYQNTAGGIPGLQLVVDLNNDGTPDGILVGEPSFYGDDWWANSQLDNFIAANPGTAPGARHGYAHAGSLSEWSTAYADARILAFGFSLGSGVKGDGVIDALNFNGTRYTFAQHTILPGKNECKDGGWATSTKPFFKNQGECVSSFASAKSAGKFLAR